MAPYVTPATSTKFGLRPPITVVAALWLIDGPLNEVCQEARRLIRSVGVHSAAIFGDSSLKPRL